VRRFSVVRNFSEDAFINSWYGYELLRHFVFQRSSYIRNSDRVPTEANMRVEGFLELIGGEKHGHDGHENSEFRAHLGRSSWPLTPRCSATAHLRDTSGSHISSLY
jgi:hypothetical protein